MMACERKEDITKELHEYSGSLIVIGARGC